MTKARCFWCGNDLGIGKSMEELLEDRLPVFCSINCSTSFPDNGTTEFEEIISILSSLLEQKS